MEDADDEEITALFVEAFGDRERFFNVCLKELEKAEAIIASHMDRTNFQDREGTQYGDDEDFAEDIPETQEDRIQVLFDLFKDKDLVTLTKYIKVFSQGNGQILGIAHAKLNADFDKAFKKLKLEPDDEDVKHVKSFTKPNGDQMSGKGTMKATACKIFKLKNFSKNFREKILNLFNMEVSDIMSEEEINTDENVAQSQDHPMHTQSRTAQTLKVCSCCKFRSRDVEEFDEHMKQHPKCPQCGLHFKNDTNLSEHHKAFHAKINCTKCGKLILENSLKKHMNGHVMEKGFLNVVSKGKVKASRAKGGDESVGKKESKLNAYRMFLKTKRPEIRNIHPDATPQEMIVLLNAEWNKEKAAGRKDIWHSRAQKENEEADSYNDDDAVTTLAGSEDPDVPLARSAPLVAPIVAPLVVVEANHSVDAPLVEAFHEIRRCDLCGLMIANLNAHMMLAHKPDDANQDEEEVSLQEIDQVEGEEGSKGQDNEEIETAVVANFSVGDIIMVLRKTLHWPGKIMSITNKTFEVMVYDKARTVEHKHEKYIMPFSSNVSCCDGRGAAWVKAWKAAKAAYDNRR